MVSIFMMANGNQAVAELRNGLCDSLFAYNAVDRNQPVAEQLARQSPALVVVELDDYPDIHELARQIKQERAIPIIALVRREKLGSLDITLPVDDFIISPYDAGELELRIKRLLNKTEYGKDGTIIRCGDLLIDQDSCEVTLSGHKVMLTYKEYELLKFLAINPDRVFPRETLLNKVWGYDYYGGDRTVDVHIRRLRSKIEDASHTFIETVRNIGYRFRKGLQ